MIKPISFYASSFFRHLNFTQACLPIIHYLTLHLLNQDTTKVREIEPKDHGERDLQQPQATYLHPPTASQTLADVTESPAYGKIPALRTPDDRLDPNRFPSDEYYHLLASSDNTYNPSVHSRSRNAYYHLRKCVRFGRCREASAEVGTPRHKNKDITCESWVEAVQVYNIFTLFPEISASSSRILLHSM